MSSKKKILIVDDEKELVALVSLHIKMQGFNVLSCDGGEEALEIARREKPDLIILDLMLPKYVTKPFSPRELVARVKRVLARTTAKPPASLKRYNLGDLEVNLVDSVVRVKGEEVYLTRKETDILKILIERANELVTHEQILGAVWDQDTIVEYANIAVHISHLREKLEKDPSNPKIIKTVKGEGYKFESKE